MRSIIALATIFISASATGAVPEWVQLAVRATSTDSLSPDDRGVALLEETSIVVRDDGEMRITSRKVYRILSTAGRDLAVARVFVNDDVKLERFQAWSIGPDGSEHEVKEREAVELSAFEGELYADDRVKLIKLPTTDPGSTVAFEYVQRTRPYGLQSHWPFQTDVPVRVGRYSVTVPDGWNVESRWLNSPAHEPVVSGNRHLWEVRDVEAVSSETGMPSSRAVAARMVVNLHPPSGLKVEISSNSTWNDIARWYSDLVEPRLQATPGIRAKAKELTSNSSEILEKIAAVSAFAQRDVRYVAIAIGIGGYQPHHAGQIFDVRYGDCKDKVTLLASMLRQIGVDSHFVLVHTDPGVVARAFPSMYSFNHAVIAIALPEEMGGEEGQSFKSVIEHPELGRLLVFDPTHPTVPLGRLPDYLQGTEALLVGNEIGEIVSLPVDPPIAHKLLIRGKFSLDRGGRLSGEVEELRAGWIGAEYRAVLAKMQPSEYAGLIRKRLATDLVDFSIEMLEIEGLYDLDSELVMRYRLVAPSYGRNVGGLMLARPRVIGSKRVPVLAETDRKYPYELRSPAMERDEIEIQLDPGLVADDLPPSVQLALPQLSYRSETVLEGSVLRYQRDYEVSERFVEASRVGELREAFRAILSDEKNQAVLKIE